MSRNRLLCWMLIPLVTGVFALPTLAAEAKPPDHSAAVAEKRDRGPTEAERKKRQAERRKQAEERAESLRKLMQRVGLGPGAVVADVGAGKGQDSWVLADIVGPEGKVYAEEIGQEKVDRLKEEAKRRQLPQVQAILGRADDPCLPEASVDVAYMRHVYHHFSKPREMLRHLWRSLKPGGYLVVVDRHRGTLRDWVPREARAKKHYWIAETTVVREAREEGFAFSDCAEDCWPAEDQFVLIFQRPVGVETPGGDPDAPLPLPLEKTARLLAPTSGTYRRPVFVALGQARQLIGSLMAQASGPGLDVVLEEWATQKDERPPLPPGVELPPVLTENGQAELGPDPVDVVFFLDTYHLLFHHQTLLAQLHEHLTPDGRVYVLDRRAEENLPRREASHRRKIAPEKVKQEMAEAGFYFWSERPAPAADRFLLVFGKRPPAEEVQPATTR